MNHEVPEKSIHLYAVQVKLNCDFLLGKHIMLKLIFHRIALLIISYATKSFGFPNTPEWQQIYTRVHNSARTRYEQYPTARRGHTAVNMADKMYIFGGNANLPPCEFGHHSQTENFPCSAHLTDDDNTNHSVLSPYRAQLTNELWAFDPTDNTWELLSSSFTESNENNRPQSREFHSAVVMPDSHMLVFGGKGYRTNDSSSKSGLRNDTDFIYLNDLWKLDAVGHIDRSFTAHGVSRSVPIEEGKFINLNLNVSQIFNEEDKLMCVKDFQVEVTVKHPCTRQLSITIYTPPSSENVYDSEGHAIEVSSFVSYVININTNNLMM